jgi:hypothetical protein
MKENRSDHITKFQFRLYKWLNVCVLTHARSKRRAIFLPSWNQSSPSLIYKKRRNKTEPKKARGWGGGSEGRGQKLKKSHPVKSVKISPQTPVSEEENGKTVNSNVAAKKGGKLGEESKKKECFTTGSN